MFTRKACFLYVLLTVLLLVCGCSGDSDTPEDSGTTSPLPSVSPLSPLASPAPEQEVGPTPTVPEPESGVGTVVGVLYDQASDQPYAHQFIYLAKVGKMEAESGEGEPLLFAELDVSSAPFAQTDETGRLVIENVEPAQYALVVRLPNLQEIMLYDPVTNASLSVEVQPGQITDMGVVEIIGPR